jgi:Flp pilus assembly pilin Flp
MTHKKIANKLKNIFNNNGQGMVEYILIIAFIALAILASLAPMGKILADKFTEFAAKVGS